MISLYDILKAANGQLFGEPSSHLFAEFCFSARQITPGSLFVAMRTSHGDGHAEIAEAIARGARGVVCHGPPDCDTTGVTVLMVRDTIDALLAWSRYTLTKHGTKVIAVSGSSGKSVAVEALAHILSLRYPVHRGNVDEEGWLGLPLSLASLESSHEFVVLKIDVMQPGEMMRLLQIVRPQVVVLGHLEAVYPPAFSSADAYYDEHRALAKTLSANSLLVLNSDDEASLDLRHHTQAQWKLIGIDQPKADISAFNVVVGAERTGFDVRYGSERYLGRWSPLIGVHLLYGVLAAVLVGAHYGIPLDESLKAVTSLNPLPGRMRPLIGRQGSLLVDDTYRANVASTLAALNWLNVVRRDYQRAFFVIGELDRLSGRSQQDYRQIGCRAAEVVDSLITLGAEASLAGRAAMDFGLSPQRVHMLYSPQDVLSLLAPQLTADDIVLVKGGVASDLDLVMRGLLNDLQDEVLLLPTRQAQRSITAAPVPLRPTWLVFDADALAMNVRCIAAHLGQDKTLMAVVKADGYGHGAVRTARIALMNGASWLAVANIDEALTLRQSGVDAPILVLSYVPSHAVRQAIRENLAVVIFDEDQARSYDRMARDVGQRLICHVKIDTGMGRLGILADDAVRVFRQLASMTNLHLQGIYTHFSSADDDTEYTAKQTERFKALVRALRAAPFNFEYIHAANSAASLYLRDPLFNMVRVGLMLYGLNPSKLWPIVPGVRPVLSWKTTVLQVRHFPPNSPIGYGNTYRTQGYETIAILPVGYADGFRRAPRTWREVLIQGRRAPLVGRVSMEKCAVNVSHIPNVDVGDEVVLLGAQGEDAIWAEEIAEWLGTINYEVVTQILPRQPR
ncbi:MAG: alanine racemase [Anaerolineae bacterium]|nr:alanine racemase [Anaerolineae bacterium]MDW8172360.1 alanine racemase [Anaerolineae bacterium]